MLDCDQIMQVEQLANIGLNTEQIADFFGFSRDTFYEIRKRQPEVLRHYKKGRSNGLALSASENTNLILTIIYEKFNLNYIEFIVNLYTVLNTYLNNNSMYLDHFNRVMTRC